jgi:outer membrane immunogenic protein
VLAQGALATIRRRFGYSWDRLLVFWDWRRGLHEARLHHKLCRWLGASRLGGSITSGEKTGWTAGGGLECALWSNWTVKAEYLYARFQGINKTTLLCQ